MGHLINSTATRLGWFKHWADVWFAKDSHYAELTMSCLRMRFFLIYLFFSREIMIKHLLLFSHFQMIKVFKTFIVKLFYYDGALEDSIDDCLDLFKSKLRPSKWRYIRHRRALHKIKRKKGQNFNNIGINKFQKNSDNIKSKSLNSDNTKSFNSDIIKFNNFEKKKKINNSKKIYDKYDFNYDWAGLLNRYGFNNGKIKSVLPVIHKIEEKMKIDKARDKWIFRLKRIQALEKAKKKKLLKMRKNWTLVKVYTRYFKSDKYTIDGLPSYNKMKINVKWKNFNLKSKDYTRSLIIYKNYIDYIKKLFIIFRGVSNWTKLSLKKDFLYKAQQIEIKWYLDELYVYLNKYNLTVKKINYYKDKKVKIWNLNNLRNNIISQIIQKYKILRERIFSLKKLNIKNSIKFGGFSTNNYKIKKWIGLNLWAFSKNFIRLRYDNSKYPRLRKKKLKWLKRIIFKMATKMKWLSRRYLYRFQTNKLIRLNRIKLNINININKIYYKNITKYYILFRKIRLHLINYLKWSDRKKLKLNIYNMKLFNKLIERTSYLKSKIYLFRLKKIYYNCLFQFKSRTKVEQLKFEINLKKKIATVLKYWHRLIKKNMVIYNLPFIRWEKNASAEWKKYIKKLNNRQKYLKRKRENNTLNSWGTVMRKFWRFKNSRIRKRIGINSFKKLRSPFIVNKLLGHRTKNKYKRVLPQMKKKFLGIILQTIGNLPAAIFVKRLQEHYISKYELHMRWKEGLIKEHEKLMDEDRIERAKKKRDKAIKKLLASNKLTNKELDIDLYSLPLVEDISEKKPVKKKNLKKFLKNLKISEKRLKEIELKSKNSKAYLKNKNYNIRFKNYKGDALRFLPKERKLWPKSKFYKKKFKIRFELKMLRNLINRWSGLDKNNFSIWWKKFRGLLLNHNKLLELFELKYKYKTKLNKLNAKKLLKNYYKLRMKKINYMRLGKEDASYVRSLSMRVAMEDPYLKKLKVVGLPSRIVNRLLRALRKGNSSLRLRKFFGNKGLINDLTRGRSLALILFSAVCTKWFKGSINSAKLGTTILFELFRFIHILESSVGLNRYISNMLLFLVSTALLQLKVRKIKFDFFILGNDSVNAIFLARYIANKFRQNLSLRRVLNPLTREFKRVSQMYSYSSRLINSSKRELHFREDKNQISLQYGWGEFFRFCSEGYSNFSRNLSYSELTWFTLDILIIYIWIKKMGFNKTQVRSISLYFTKRLNSFFISFSSDINNLFIDLSVFIVNGKLFNFYSYPYWNKIFTYLLRPIIISYPLFDNIDRFRRSYPLLLKLASRSYYRFFKYNYWLVNYKAWYQIKFFNYSKARERVEFPPTNLFRGFKIHCLGRFSRRQRSKSFWINMGLAPLNTFSANIDYGNYCIPIKNSLISVKIWIYMADPTLSPSDGFQHVFIKKRNKYIH